MEREYSNQNIEFIDIPKETYKQLKKNSLRNLIKWKSKHVCPGHGNKTKVRYDFLTYSLLDHLKGLNNISNKKLIENTDVIVLKKKIYYRAEKKEKTITETKYETPISPTRGLTLLEMGGLWEIINRFDSSNYKTSTERILTWKSHKKFPFYTLIIGEGRGILKEIIYHLASNIIDLLPEDEQDSAGTLHYNCLGFWNFGKIKENKNLDYYKRERIVKNIEDKLEKGLAKIIRKNSTDKNMSPQEIRTIAENNTKIKIREKIAENKKIEMANKTKD